MENINTIINGISYALDIEDDYWGDVADMRTWSGARRAVSDYAGDEYDIDAITKEAAIWCEELGRYILPDQTPLVDICIKHRIES